MLNRFLAIFLLFALISTSFTRVFVYAAFEVNGKYIAENLCVNKDKPWMHCNGKCYLANKLKEAIGQEKHREQQIQKNLFQDFICSSGWTFEISLPVTIKEPMSYRAFFYVNTTARAIFHPPPQGKI